MTRKRPIFWMIVLCLGCAPQAMAGMLIGSTADAIYDIDPVTGAASNPRPTSQRFELTFAGDVLYGISEQSLYTLDVATGASTLLGRLPISSGIGAVDIAWDGANDRLLGLFFAPGRGALTIYEIDPVSVNSRFIRFVDKQYTSLAFTETGQLFAIDTILEEVGLLDLVDFSTVSASVLSAEVGNPSIASDGHGGLFLLSVAALGEPAILNALDPLTGILTPLGSTQTGSWFSSLAYIPEPGSLVLLLIAAGVFFAGRVSPFPPTASNGFRGIRIISKTRGT